jgi:hypothetical protein
MRNWPCAVKNVRIINTNQVPGNTEIFFSSGFGATRVKLGVPFTRKTIVLRSGWKVNQRFIELFKDNFNLDFFRT